MAHLVDLSDWLKEQNKDSLGSEGRETINDSGIRQNLTCFAKQIALAVDYLHDREIIYKDLACRNCFLDATKMLVKLASFNIEIDTDETACSKQMSLKSMIRPKYLLDYYVIDSRPSEGNLLPLSWIPLESILFNKFNKQTDIWSLGCLLYELFSLGEVAYFGYSSKQIIDTIRSNLMPPKPLLCPNSIYKLMCKCLSDIPTLRPNVKQIYEQLNLYSGQCSSFLDHHLCSLASAMCSAQPIDETPVGEQARQQPTIRMMNRGSDSITKTRSYANIEVHLPSTSNSFYGAGRCEQKLSLSSGYDIPNQASSVVKRVTQGSLAKIPQSKSINCGANRLVHSSSSSKQDKSEDGNHYDEPVT